MTFPDVESMVRAFLSMKVSPVPVSTKVPNPRPAKFVRAWRTGGAAVNRVLEAPLVTVQAWAASSVAASSLARECREALLHDVALMPLVRGVSEVTGLHFDPDPGTGVDRYTFTVQLQVRAHR